MTDWRFVNVVLGLEKVIRTISFQNNFGLLTNVFVFFICLTVIAWRRTLSINRPLLQKCLTLLPLNKYWKHLFPSHFPVCHPFLSSIFHAFSSNIVYDIRKTSVDFIILTNDQIEPKKRWPNSAMLFHFHNLCFRHSWQHWLRFPTNPNIH